LNICALCGTDDNIEGCHVKSKRLFSYEDIDDGYDRYMNLIYLCHKHHLLFDNKKKLSIADLGPNKPIVFVRWEHCSDGFCISEPKVPIRVLELLEWGGTGDRIKPEYIRKKNKNSEVSELISFTKTIPPKYEYTVCTRVED